MSVVVWHFDSVYPALFTADLIGFLKVFNNTVSDTGLVVRTVRLSEFRRVERTVVLAYDLCRGNTQICGVVFVA